MSGSSLRSFIDLNRTFHELSSYARESDEVDVSTAFRASPSVTWEDLKAERRVVLLAEAGAGKTEEIRQAALRWRATGHHAFFLRLEHVADNLDLAFEVGDAVDFEQWRSSLDEGWVLLDSVDEARLRAPADFERAIRRFADRVQGAEDRLHVLITSRTSAWRPRTDLEFCERLLPPPPTGRLAIAEGEGEAWGAAIGVAVTSHASNERPRYRIVTLGDLDQVRIKKFVDASGIDGLHQFLDAIERRDAWAYTRRPQDLLELIEFWRAHGRIGSRLELVRSSVARRLEERDPTRDEWQSIPADRMRAAAGQISAACILIHDATIQVPDGSPSGSGLRLRDLLQDWDARELSILLSRPLFDEAIYGAVRFHHREAREYLAAEWFANLLRRETSRARIEALFFRQQYDLEVVTPTLRPVLPWLALLDQRIRERLLRVAPQVLFEGGDPSQLPKVMREAILRDCCRGLADTAISRTFTDHATVQRFAAPDLVEEIRNLLRMHASSHEVTAFLCRMIWIGPLPELQPEANALALSEDGSTYTRIVAIRALAAIGAVNALVEVREKVLGTGDPIDRELLAALVTATLRDTEDVEWFSAALRAAATPRPHAVDLVIEALKERIEGASLPLLRALTRAFSEFLAETPQIDSSYCPISQTWAWLAAPAASTLAVLAAKRDLTILEKPCLELIRRVGLARQHSTGLEESKSKLGSLIKSWDTLNWSLFWHEVTASRSRRLQQGMGSTKHFVEVWPTTLFYSFTMTNFDYIVNQISARSEPDDHAVALSVAFKIFNDEGRPDLWRRQLTEVTAGDDILEALLRAFLNPPPEAEEWRRQEKASKIQAKRATLREARHRAEWRDGLQKNIELLRNSGLVNPPGVSRNQSYLLDRMREANIRTNRWTDGIGKTCYRSMGPISLKLSEMGPAASGEAMIRSSGLRARLQTQLL